MADREGPNKCLLESSLCPIASGWPHVCSFSSTCELPTLSLWNLRWPPWSRMVDKPQLPGVSLGFIFLWNSYPCRSNKFGHFLLLICLVLNWLEVQPEELRKVEGELSFCSYSYLAIPALSSYISSPFTVCTHLDIVSPVSFLLPNSLIITLISLPSCLFMEDNILSLRWDLAGILKAVERSEPPNSKPSFQMCPFL